MNSTAWHLLRNLSPESKAHCWEVKRANAAGYGRVKVGDAVLLAHRVSYETFIGPIPPELEIDHICHNRRCINPNHLEPVTSSENKRRAAPYQQFWGVAVGNTYVTKREQEVIDTVRKGLTQAEAARALGLSYQTVKNTLANARKRLGVKTIYELVLMTPAP